MQCSIRRQHTVDVHPFRCAYYNNRLRSQSTNPCLLGRRQALLRHVVDDCVKCMFDDCHRYVHRQCCERDIAHLVLPPGKVVCPVCVQNVGKTKAYLRTTTASSTSSSHPLASSRASSTSSSYPLASSRALACSGPKEDSIGRLLDTAIRTEATQSRHKLRDTLAASSIQGRRLQKQLQLEQQQ